MPPCDLVSLIAFSDAVTWPKWLLPQPITSSPNKGGLLAQMNASTAYTLDYRASFLSDVPRAPGSFSNELTGQRDIRCATVVIARNSTGNSEDFVSGWAKAAFPVNP